MSILYNIYTHVFTEYFDRYGLSGEAGAKKNTVSGYPSLAVGVWPAWDTPAKGRGYPGSDNPFRKWLNIPIPIGSMYAIYNIYSNIYHQYTPNVGKYSIHGSYGICEPWCWNMNPNMCPKKITQFCRFLYSSTMVRIWDKSWQNIEKSSSCLTLWDLTDMRRIYVGHQPFLTPRTFLGIPTYCG